MVAKVPSGEVAASLSPAFLGEKVVFYAFLPPYIRLSSQLAEELLKV